MRQSRLCGLQAGHHAGELDGAVLIGNLDHPASADRSVIGLDHNIMAIRKSRDLCEVGDHDDLGVLGESGQPAADFDRDLAAYASINLLDTATHSCDLAVATGQPATLPDDVARAALEASRSIVSPEIRAGRFHPEHAAPDGADATTRLVAFLGRPV